jgi:hypothetical protein
MNTCEDQSEPLGENPDVPARYDAGIGSVLEAIDRGSVIGVLSAADAVLATRQLAERQTQALNCIRELAATWAGQSDEYGDLDTKQQIADGRALLKILEKAGA